MRTPLKFVVLVGVALGVTPIFSSVSAQQAGSQAKMLLEMQSLRAEIAQLRDMVERQQYQMRKLQRSLEQGGQAGQFGSQGRPNQTQPYQGQGQQAYPNTQVPGQQQGYQPAPYSGPGQQRVGSGPQYDDNPTTGSTVNSASSTQGYRGSSGGSVQTTVQTIPGSVTLNEGYRPNTPGSANASTGDLSSSEYPVSNPLPSGSQNGTPIEERVIGAPRLPSSGSTFPPVVDRSVGGGDNVSSPNAQSAVRDSGFAGNDQTTITQYPIDASATPQPPGTISSNSGLNRDFGGSGVPQATSGQGGSGIIAIPTNPANRPASNRGYPPVGNSQSRTKVVSVQQAGAAQATGLSEQDYYQRGFGLLKDSKHSEAVNIFKQQISSYPQGSYADDAHYWIAESMYVNRALDDSKQYFRAIIDNYSQSPRLPDAMLKTAYIEQEQGNVIEARILLQEIIQYHPRSNAAISAKNRLPELK